MGNASTLPPFAEVGAKTWAVGYQNPIAVTKDTRLRTPALTWVRRAPVGGSQIELLHYRVTPLHSRVISTALCECYLTEL